MATLSNNMYKTLKKNTLQKNTNFMKHHVITVFKNSLLIIAQNQLIKKELVIELTESQKLSQLILVILNLYHHKWIQNNCLNLSSKFKTLNLMIFQKALIGENKEN